MNSPKVGWVVWAEVPQNQVAPHSNTKLEALVRCRESGQSRLDENPIEITAKNIRSTCIIEVLRIYKIGSRDENVFYAH